MKYKCRICGESQEGLYRYESETDLYCPWCFITYLCEKGIIIAYQQVVGRSAK